MNVNGKGARAPNNAEIALQCSRNLDSDETAQIIAAAITADPAKAQLDLEENTISSRDSSMYNSRQLVKRKLSSDGEMEASSKKRALIISSKSFRVSEIPEDILIKILLFLIGGRNLMEGPACVNKHWRSICLGPKLWGCIPTFINGHINELSLIDLGQKNAGTEGICTKFFHHKSQNAIALKKPRVYPEAEGLPYYMLREIAFLKGLVHPNISIIENISLVNNDLRLYFRYVPNTLFDLINPFNDSNGGKPLPLQMVKRLAFQILQGVAHCHQRGVLHRNIKPKHILVDIPLYSDALKRLPVGMEKYRQRDLLNLPKDCTTEDVHRRILEVSADAHVRLSDFALVRSTSIPLRLYTYEVVTLWYRAPEVLMGDRYFTAVDIWSVGCVFAEMVTGRPFMPGICEVDQLFQIFSKLGSPTSESWPGFDKLPNYQFKFPNWKPRSLSTIIPNMCDEGIDLLSRLLCPNPHQRISASDALQHPYFDEIREEQIAKASTVTFAFQQQPVVPSRLEDYCYYDPIKDTSVRPVGTCWKYANRQIKPPLPNDHIESGLANPTYLLRYYHHIKREESLLFPFESQKLRDAFNDSIEDPSNRISPLHRAILVDWLMEIVDVFDMSVKSVFLAVNFADRYLCLDPVGRNKLQILGATCLHIASKCEDVSYIGVEDLVVCSDQIFKPVELLTLEEEILTKLNFDIAVPTSLDFLNVFQTRLVYDADLDAACYISSVEGQIPPPSTDLTPESKFMGQYLIELALQESFFISQMPSCIAAAALVLSCHYCELELSPDRIDALTGYTVADLKTCIKRLSEAFEHAPFNQGHHVIHRRYTRQDRLEVAKKRARRLPAIYLSVLE